MLAGAATPVLADDRRVAFVIGNTHYAGYPPLPTCEVSAKIVATALTRAGFDVREKNDLANAPMGSELSAFAEAASSAAASVVYVCGYIATASDRLFLLPVSARLEREGDVRTQGLLARLLAPRTTDAARADLILLDVVNLPGDRARLPEQGLVGSVHPGTGLVASRSLVTAGGGTTPLAKAVASSLTATTPDALAVVRAIAAELADIPGQAVTVQEPQRAAPLLAPPAAPAAPQPAPPPPPQTTAEPAPPAPLETDLRHVQAALRQRGYYAGIVDGRPGPETAAAIRRYQNELKADMTGRLTPDQARQLFATQPRP